MSLGHDIDAIITNALRNMDETSSHITTKHSMNTPHVHDGYLLAISNINQQPESSQEVMDIITTARISYKRLWLMWTRLYTERRIFQEKYLNTQFGEEKQYNKLKTQMVERNKHIHAYSKRYIVLHTNIYISNVLSCIVANYVFFCPKK